MLSDDASIAVSVAASQELGSASSGSSKPSLMQFMTSKTSAPKTIALPANAKRTGFGVGDDEEEEEMRRRRKIQKLDYTEEELLLQSSSALAGDDEDDDEDFDGKYKKRNKGNLEADKAKIAAVAAAQAAAKAAAAASKGKGSTVTGAVDPLAAAAASAALIAQEHAAKLAASAKQIMPLQQMDPNSKERLKMLVDQIPTTREELFAYPIAWNVVDHCNIAETVMLPWVAKKTEEYLGEEEESLTSFIIDNIKGHCQPSKLLEELSMVLDDDSEQFTLKIWRMLIYHTLLRSSSWMNQILMNDVVVDYKDMMIWWYDNNDDNDNYNDDDDDNDDDDNDDEKNKKNKKTKKTKKL